MRHTFHFLFSSALLLGFCIVSNVQKSESDSQDAEHPGIAQEKLQALSSIRYSADLIFMSGNMVPAILTSDKEKPGQHEYQVNEASMVRNRTQKLIYLELKPILLFRSGQYFHTPRNFGDPALS